MIEQIGVQPLGYKVLIRLKELEEKTKGGIYLPESTKATEEEAHQMATVVNYGPAAFTTGLGDLPSEWDIKPKIGDIVLINRYSGIKFEKEGISGKYRLINDKEILAIIKE